MSIYVKYQLFPALSSLENSQRHLNTMKDENPVVAMSENEKLSAEELGERLQQYLLWRRFETATQVSPLFSGSIYRTIRQQKFYGSFNTSYKRSSMTMSEKRLQEAS